MSANNDFSGRQLGPYLWGKSMMIEKKYAVVGDNNFANG